MKAGRTLVALGAGVAAALILTGLGFTWPFVVGWGLLIAALGLLGQLAMPLEPGADAPHIPVEPDRRPTEISRMAWALNTHTGLAGQQVVRRVREILRYRLERQGVDPDDPAQRTRTVALLDGDLWERLTNPGTTIVDIERSLDAADRLGSGASAHSPHPTHPAAPSSGSALRTLLRRSRR